MKLDIPLRYLLAPVMAWQGLRLRKTALVLPEASGPRSGALGDGPLLRFLILGDSSAAGVGVSHQNQALCGQLVERLAQDRRVEWTLIARTGATTRDAIGMLKRANPTRFDVALIALGVNDVTRLRSVRRFRTEARALRAQLRSEFGVSLVVVTDVPPMKHFLALPPLLKWVLGAQAERFSAALAEDIAREPESTLPELDLPFHPQAMAEDGFHPSASTYAMWADVAARIIKRAM